MRHYLVPNAHDEIDHGNGVEIDVPEGHEAENSNLYGDDGEDHPERADGVGDEDERNDHHHHGRYRHTLHRRRHHSQELGSKQRILSLEIYWTFLSLIITWSK